MCGIATISIAPNERTLNPTTFTASLLRHLESRGRDASGIAWTTRAGETFVMKDDMAGRLLAKHVDLDDAQDIVIHTRWATKGDPADNNNNHPIDVGGIVGVHNGHCRNDDALLSLCDGYERQGQVDSEAIFALLAHGPSKLGTCGRLAMVQGNAAVAWLTTGDMHEGVNLARIVSSPLVFANTSAGSFVAASTELHLAQAARDTGVRLFGLESLPEGAWMRVRRGRIDDYRRFTPRHLPKPMPMHDYTQASLWQEVTA